MATEAAATRTTPMIATAQRRPRPRPEDDPPAGAPNVPLSATRSTRFVGRLAEGSHGSGATAAGSAFGGPAVGSGEAAPESDGHDSVGDSGATDAPDAGGSGLAGVGVAGGSGGTMGG